MLSQLREDVMKASDPEKAKFLARFFKTGVGQYGEGDIFLGITVPQSRKIVARYRELPFQDLEKILQSTAHEERLIALLILVEQYKRGDEKARQAIYDFYLAHTQYINNWDLVDLSADKIVGEHLVTPVIARRETTKQSLPGVQPSRGLPRFSASWRIARNDVLHKLAHSQSLWERRIGIIATFAFIKHGSYEETFAVADILLKSPSTSSGRSDAPHDLIQKAVGWMLREVGKRVSEEKLEAFLRSRYKEMPRTALRYAIERFSEEKRKKYLKGEIRLGVDIDEKG